MRKKTLLALLVCLCLSLTVSACVGGEGKGFSFKLESGQDIPAEITAELGELCSVPTVVASENGVTADVTVAVTDSKGTEVSVNNNRFRAKDSLGYTILFTSGEHTLRVTVKVKDTHAPTVTINAPNGMVVVHNQSFSIPTATVNDASGETINPVVTVKDKDENAVTVTENKFVAAVIGEYSIIYTVTDSSGNSDSKTLTVSCETADVLSGFESEGAIGFTAFTAVKEVVTENTATGNAVKLTVNDPAENAYRRICVPIKDADGEYVTWANLQKYEKVQVYVYLSADNEIGLADQTKPVKKGANVLVFTREEIQSAYAFSSAQYEENANGFYFNLRYPTNGSYVIFDDFLGIYERGYVPEEPDDFTFNVSGVSGMVAAVNESFVIPTCTVTLTEGGELDFETTVKDPSGTSVTVTNGSFTPTVLGTYTITYTLTSQGHEGSYEITVDCEKSAILNDFSAATDITYVAGYNSTVSLESQTVITGSAVKVLSQGTGEWVQIYVPLKSEDDFISWKKLQKFEKLRIYVYTSVNCELALANGDPRISIKKGWNVVEFSMEKIIASRNFSVGQYTEGANGFYLTMPSVETDSYLIFDRFIGVYAKDYVEDSEGEISIKGASGMIALTGVEFTVPTCTATGANDTQLEYSVSVKDSANAEVTVTNGKFTPTVLGNYTITYTITSAGYEGSEEIVVKCEKAVMLNDFNAAADVTWVGGYTNTQAMETSNTLTGSGVKITATAAVSYSQLYMPLTDVDGYVTWENLQKFDKIQIYVYSSEASEMMLSTGSSPRKALVKGWNIIEFSMSEIVAQKALADTQYSENANGFYLCQVSGTVDSYLIFDEIYGIMAENA